MKQADRSLLFPLLMKALERCVSPRVYLSIPSPFWKSYIYGDIKTSFLGKVRIYGDIKTYFLGKVRIYGDIKTYFLGKVRIKTYRFQ